MAATSTLDILGGFRSTGITENTVVTPSDGFRAADLSAGSGSGTIGTITLSVLAAVALITGLGDPGTINLSGVTGSGAITYTAGGAVGTINLSAPSAVTGEIAKGSIGTITLTGPTFLISGLTQYGLETLAQGAADSRITQFGLEAMAQPAAFARTTLMGLLVLAKGGDTPLVPDPLSLHDMGRDQVVYQRMVNMYVEPTPQGPGQSARYQRPGLYSAAQRGGGPVRATFLWKGFRIVVSGGTVWRDTTNIGSVNPSGPVRFAFSNDEVVITANGTAYYVTTTDVSPIVSPTIAGLNIIDVVFLSGRFVYIVGGGTRFYFSALNDAQTIDGLNFEEVNENNADFLIGATILADQIVFFTSTAIEWWYASTDPAAPFQRSPGRRNERGLAAQQSLVKLDNAVFFVGENRIVYRTGAVPQRVSDFSVEDKLRRVAQASLPNITAFGLTFGGHTFYGVNLPGFGTWVLDIAQGLWAEWKSYARPFFRVNVSDPENNVLGDLYAGNLMGVDGKQWFDLVDDPIERVVSSYASVKAGWQKNFNLALDCTRGVGLASGYGSDPIVEMRFSDNEGKTWTGWLQTSLGAMGDGTDNAKAIWYQLGSMRSPGRLFEFRCSDPVFFAPWQVRFNEPRM